MQVGLGRTTEFAPENRVEVLYGGEAAACGDVSFHLWDHYRFTGDRDFLRRYYPAMDEELIRFLFGAVIDASQTLHVDAVFRKELEARRARLAPIQVGADGRILQYLQPYRETEIHHRHESHLWALFPGDQISVQATP